MLKDRLIPTRTLGTIREMLNGFCWATKVERQKSDVCHPH